MTQVFTSDYPLKNIQPGGIATIEAGQGGQVYVRSASHDNFDLRIEGIGDLIGHAGLQLRNVNVRKIRVENTGVEPLDVVINIGSAEIIDRRASVSEILRVHDPIDGTSFADVLAMMQNADKNTKGLLPIGSSHFGLYGGSGVYTVVNPASNTNGVIIRRGMIASGGARIFVCAGTSAPANDTDASKNNLSFLYGAGSDSFEGIKIPVGQGLYAVPGSSNTVVTLSYEVL